MQNVVQVLEKQYLEEKRSALEEQRLRYERELDLLRQQLSPERSSQHHQRSNSDRLTFPTHTKMRLWTEDRYTHTHTRYLHAHAAVIRLGISSVSGTSSSGRVCPGCESRCFVLTRLSERLTSCRRRWANTPTTR